MRQTPKRAKCASQMCEPNVRAKCAGGVNDFGTCAQSQRGRPTRARYAGGVNDFGTCAQSQRGRPTPPKQWRSGRAVEGTGLENQRTGNGTKGSNPFSSVFLTVIPRERLNIMMRAIYELLTALSRLPGLSFLRDIARPLYKVEQTKRQIERVGSTAKNLKDKISD